MADKVLSATQMPATAPLIGPELFRVLSLLLPPDEFVGGREIARALVGRDDPPAIRSTYYKLETKNPYAAYKKGSQWAMRLSTLQAKIWSQEQRAFADEDQRTLALLHMLLSGAVPLFAEAASGTCNPQQLAELALASSEAAKLIHKLLRDQGNAVSAEENAARPRRIA